MALRKIINTEGISIVRTTIGDIENGTKQVSFSAYVKVVNISGDKNQITANVNFKGDVIELNLNLGGQRITTYAPKEQSNGSLMDSLNQFRFQTV